MLTHIPTIDITERGFVASAVYLEAAAVLVLEITPESTFLLVSPGAHLQRIYAVPMAYDVGTRTAAVGRV